MIVVTGDAFVIAERQWFEGRADVESLEESVDDDSTHCESIADSIISSINPEPVPCWFRQVYFAWKLINA